MPSIHLNMDDRQDTKIRELARKLRLNRSAYIRRAVDELNTRVERQLLAEQFKAASEKEDMPRACDPNRFAHPSRPSLLHRATSDPASSGNLGTSSSAHSSESRWLRPRLRRDDRSDPGHRQPTPLPRQHRCPDQRRSHRQVSKSFGMSNDVWRLYWISITGSHLWDS